MSKSKNKITSGTKEWASSNINIYSGCSNDCVYCYAKKMAIRFKRKTNENWKDMILNEKAFNKRYGKRKGRVMYPSTHDITIETITNNIIFLKNEILLPGNIVLITTKPDPRCIEKLCSELSDYKSQIQFRFTITSFHDKILKEFEPNAPSFNQRFQALQYAYKKGWKTSLSIEPFLDNNPIPMIETIAPFVSDTIWVGKLNYVKTEFNSLENIINIVERLRNLPEDIKSKIRLKDSIKNLLMKNNLEVKI